LTAVWHKLP